MVQYNQLIGLVENLWLYITKVGRNFMQEKDKCECKGKELCCKMQNEALRIAIDDLKLESYRCDALESLENIYNILSTYKCLPGKCLIKRIKWVHDNIPNRMEELFLGEEKMLKTLIKEIETFLDS